MGSATGWLRQQYRIHAAVEPPKKKVTFKLMTELGSKAKKCKAPLQEEEIAHAATIFLVTIRGSVSI